MSKIFDVFSFNGEWDLLEIRLNILYPYVDQFIIVEATETFSGNPKTPYWFGRDRRFKKFEDKIRHYVVSSNYTQEELELAQSSPNTQGAEHWRREFLQKESIKKALIHLQDEDVVFVGDADEVWEPTLANRTKDKVRKLKLKVYTYYLNSRSSEQFWGTIVGNYKDIKNECLNHLRTNSSKTSIEWGWHFTSMGGWNSVRNKLMDSYTKDTYANEQVMSNLGRNMANNKDFLGRDFTYKVDESEWPQFLKDNREKYKHLLKV
mgnify:FL=1